MPDVSQHTNPSTDFLSSIDDPTIALDLDGVCALGREYFVDVMRDRYDITMPNGWLNETNPRIPQLGCRYTDELERIIRDDLTSFLEIDPVPGSVEATKELSRDFNIKIVTHRVRIDGWMPDHRDEIRKYTEQWLERSGFQYEEFVCPTPKDKSTVAADVYIDDRISNLEGSYDQNSKLPIMFLRKYNISKVSKGAWIASASQNTKHATMAHSLGDQWREIKRRLLDAS